MYFPQFEDLDEIMQRCVDRGVVYQLQIGCDEISSLASLQLAQRYPGCYAALGLHPCDVLKVGTKDPNYHRYQNLLDYDLRCADFDELFAWFEKQYLAHRDLVLAFGETGFDRYHDASEKIFSAQKDAFHRHLVLCEKYDKPVIIHNRNSKNEFLQFWREEVRGTYNVTGVVHCLSENIEYAREVVDEFGLMVGIGGMSTYPKSEVVREAIRDISLENILLETDSPFLVPHKYRKQGYKVCEPWMMDAVAEQIADVKELPVEDVVETTLENAKKLFGVG